MNTGKSKYKLVEDFEEAVAKRALAKAHQNQPEAVQIAEILYQEAKTRLTKAIKRDRDKLKRECEANSDSYFRW